MAVRTRVNPTDLQRAEEHATARTADLRKTGRCVHGGGKRCTEHRCLDRAVDVLTKARRDALVKCDKSAHHPLGTCVHPCLGNRRADRGPIRVSSDLHLTARGNQCQVRGDPARLRSLHPERGEGQRYERGVCRSQVGDEREVGG